MRQTFILVSITACCAFFTSCQSTNDGSQHGAHTDHSSRPLLGVHTLELNEGVSPTQFEAFVSGPFTTLWREPIGGLQVRIQKADRGQDMGRYQAIWAFDSVATRDRYVPSPRTLSKQFTEKVQPMMPKAVEDRIQSMTVRRSFTDFAPVSR